MGGRTARAIILTPCPYDPINDGEQDRASFLEIWLDIIDQKNLGAFFDNVPKERSSQHAPITRPSQHAVYDSFVTRLFVLLVAIFQIFQTAWKLKGLPC